MAQRLSKMDISQVHLVGSPAIKKRYLIVKSEENMTDQEKEALEKAEKAKADEDRKAALAKAEQDAKEAQDKATAAEEAQKTAEASLSAKNAALIESALGILKSIDSEDAKAVVETVEALKDGRKVEKSTKSTEKEVSEVLKAHLPEFTKAVTEPIAKALDETKKELEEIRKSHSELVNEKVEREITEIAGKLVGEKEENLDYVRMMKKSLPPEDFVTFVQREVAKSEQVRKSGLFAEKGTSRGTSAAGDTPYDELKAIATEIAKSENISENDAFAKAILKNPELYDAYRTGSYANNGTRED